VNLTEPSQNGRYRFDGFEVDTHDFVVVRDGEVVTLTPRAFDVLVLLLKNRGHVVEKRQMFDEVWKDSFVSDNALTKVVKELRHALADSAENPRYVETVPKRGYRFIGTLEEGPVVAVESPTSKPAPQSSLSSRRYLVLAAIAIAAVVGLVWYASSGPDSRNTPATIAVLPFKPLDAESRDESLELGMAETLITRLSNLRDIVVRPIGSSRKFTDPAQDAIKAGQELQTEAVLDGSIQKVGDRIRVTARLIDVRTGATLWSEHFDDRFTDIFRVQDSIAQRITTVLALKLTRQEQERLGKHMTENPEAYELYLHGQFYWHRRGQNWIDESLKAYKLALEKDPNFALAHIGVADANIMLSGHRKISMQDAEANATPSIMRALEIDNTLAQAHNALAELKYQYQYDWRGAEDEFKIAIDLNPNVAWIHQAYGWFLMSEGRFEEANIEMETARRLDPSSLTLAMARGRLYYYSRQYDKAIQHFRHLFTLQPDEFNSNMILADIYDQNGMHAEALESYLKVRSLSGATPEQIDRLRTAFEAGGREGFLRALLRDMDERAAKTGRGSPQNYAGVYTRLGDKDKAFYWHEQLFDARDASILQFKIEPINDVLRDDPRYAKLLQRIGLEP
jgi:TolB-like protein/DNA-binding winged helix-turn-helix (wHTH) protein/Tfp pilus assembly protein PilF